jgi:hypothetical protein
MLKLGLMDKAEEVQECINVWLGDEYLKPKGQRISAPKNTTADCVEQGKNIAIRLTFRGSDLGKAI